MTVTGTTRLGLTKVSARIGARVSGVDITRPLDPETVAALRVALNEHKVLVFDAPGLDDVGQERFASQFGELTTAHPTDPALVGKPNILAVDGARDRANHWHTDSSFILNPPQINALRSVVRPAYGGETLVANTAAAYRDLPKSLLTLADTLWAEHSNEKGSKLRAADFTRFRTVHPVVRLHPLTGERGLFLGRPARTLVGLSESESRTVLDLFQSYVTRPENVLHWHWSADELMLIDLRITQHYAVDNFDDQPRLLHRVTVAGDVPVGVDGTRSHAIEGDASYHTKVAC
ncbi:TauD/TfdA dioxygenase family protein [Streptomyces sp. NPDC058682]|uniref:TauD/TfdA dioxygenase family protein n=1 Tax=Streptomyces sp. NPDC058682 TaxID=3346596 RepID=UPI00366503D7